MSLTKLLKAPINLFRKDVITFLIIRRHDLHAVEDQVCYIAVKPTASISMLRQKVWHLLELPDYCEEVIVLKSGEKEMPLTELRKGNNPQHPYLMEVWPAVSRPPTLYNNMLTMGENDVREQVNFSKSVTENKNHDGLINGINTYGKTISAETMGLHRLPIPEHKRVNFLYPEMKKPYLERLSSTTMFKLGRKKSHESFANLLIKIQSDISTLTTKLSSLETKVQQ